jgi:glutamate-1-semialdehyde 2,1-aminomutase
VYQAGTLSGNPVAVAAGLTTLSLIRAPGFFEALSQKTQAFVDGMLAVAPQGMFSAQAVGGMFGLYFAAACPQSYAEVMTANKDRFNAFFHAMLTQGIYLAPSAFEAGFVSAAHSDADIHTTIAAAKTAFSMIG